MLIGYTARKQFADRIRRFFGGAPCRVQVAALPWRQTSGGLEILLITSRDTGRWVLPKGWPEGGEALWEAAAREASEEAGIAGAIARHEAGTYYYGKRQASGAEMPCQVRVFPMQIEEIADKWPERKKRTRAWFSPVEAASKVREPDLSELISRFCGNPQSFAV